MCLHAKPEEYIRLHDSWSIHHKVLEEEPEILKIWQETAEQ